MCSFQDLLFVMHMHTQDVVQNFINGCALSRRNAITGFGVTAAAATDGRPLPSRAAPPAPHPVWGFCGRVSQSRPAGPEPAGFLQGWENFVRDSMHSRPQTAPHDQNRSEDSTRPRAAPDDRRPPSGSRIRLTGSHSDRCAEFGAGRAPPSGSRTRRAADRRAAAFSLQASSAAV